MKTSSIRVILGMEAGINLEVEQLDIKTIFPHGDLHEEINMEQPECFKIQDKEDKERRLRKSLYGLKQVP